MPTSVGVAWMYTNRQDLYLAESDTKGAIPTRHSQLITDNRKIREIIRRSNAQGKRIILTLTLGRAIAQAVSRRLPKAAARV
jgi:hypothetical protein